MPQQFALKTYHLNSNASLLHFIDRRDDAPNGTSLSH